MEANGLLNGMGEAITGRRVLDGTDLDIGHPAKGRIED